MVGKIFMDNGEFCIFPIIVLKLLLIKYKNPASTIINIKPSNNNCLNIYIYLKNIKSYYYNYNYNYGIKKRY